MATKTKLLLESLRTADGGRVVCNVMTPDGLLRQSVIEKSFFEEFAVGTPSQVMNNPQRQLRIVQENAQYLESEAERLWQQGQQALVIR